MAGVSQPAHALLCGVNKDGEYYPLKMLERGVLITRDALSLRTDLGLLFFHSEKESIKAGSSLVIRFRNDDYDTRFWWDIAFGDDQGKIEGHFYEGGQVTADGVTAVVYNRNRASDKTFSGILQHNPTVSDYGNEIWNFRVDATRRGRGESPIFPELVLKKGIEYLLVIDNVSTSDTFINSVIYFSELGRWE